MKDLGYGRMHSANMWRNPEKNLFWALDNGAFSSWLHNKPFDERGFEESLIKVERSKIRPDFIVCPDIVAGGMDSLFFSLKWVHRIPAGIPAYLAVQDGMTPQIIDKYMFYFDGLFVGGSLDWKLKTGKIWVDFAHSNRMKCHIGRVGTFKRIVWALNIGADSIDSSTFPQAGIKGYKRIESAKKQTFIH